VLGYRWTHGRMGGWMDETVRAQIRKYKRNERRESMNAAALEGGREPAFDGVSHAACWLQAQAEGFVDPATGEVRRIPFEVMVKGDKIPVYGETLEDNGRFNEDPAIPFNAYGTLALARAEFDANSGSSQIFFLLKVGRPPPPPGGKRGGLVRRSGHMHEMRVSIHGCRAGTKCPILHAE
jgi:hypothetical protein